jgi:hypothetical protein
MTRLCECGCGEPVKNRYVRGHNISVQPAPLKDRVLANLKIADNGCWIWQTAFDAYGYGRLNVKNSPRLAHRILYEELVGPIPDGLALDHLCDNRACCNPEHLEPVTRVENTRRAFDKRTTCRRGHPINEENTRIIKGRWRECRVCRREGRRQEAMA